MNNKQSLNKEILNKLVEATTQEEITYLIDHHPFFKNCSWRNYGDRGNNAGFIKAQSPDPVGALVEKITNGIDALLIRKCWDNGINPSSAEAPVSQEQAIIKFLGEKIAKFELSEKEVREIAAKTVRIYAEGSDKKPTITVVDFGEGQHPSELPNTFLSLGESNKVKIQFAHGVYNQGGSAALKFCGNGYQLILSRRAPNIRNGKDDLWGFTLVRERYEQGFKAEWYEYCIVDNEIPSFPYEPLAILAENEKFESGSYIRLFNYALQNPNLFITGQREKELAREINKRYFSMPLPIQLTELRTQLRGWSDKNKNTRIYGMWRLLKKQISDPTIIKKSFSLKTELGIFDLRNIEFIILNDEGSQGQSYKSQQEKIFLTVNGQSQHSETVNFLKTNCLLPDLAPYMVVHINLSNAGYQANKIFQTDRSGIIQIPEYDEFRKRLIDSIKGDETLKDLDQEYKERKLRNAQPEDKDLSRYIGRLVKDNPFLSKYFNIGGEIPKEEPKGPEKEFNGQYIPTIFEIEGEEEKTIPYNRYARVRLKTDAVNDYLTRSKENGDLRWTSSRLVQINQYSLKNGFMPIRLEPKFGVEVGAKDSIIFELTRPGQESLMTEISVVIDKYEDAKVKPPGKEREPQQNTLALPERKYIRKDGWADRGWTGADIAEVVKDQVGVTVYMNDEPDVLAEFPKRNPRFSSGEMMSTVKKRFFASIFLYAIAMFFELENEPEKRDWAIPNSLKAISKFLLDLTFTNRASDIVED